MAVIITPAIVCACAILAVVCWLIHAVFTFVHSLFDGGMETVENIGKYVVIALLCLAGLYVLLFVVADYAAILGVIAALFSGFFEILLTLIGIALVGGLLFYIIGTFGALILEIAGAIAVAIAMVVVNIFTWIEDTSGNCFKWFVDTINARIEKS